MTSAAPLLKYSCGHPVDPEDTRRLRGRVLCIPCRDKSIRESARRASSNHYGELKGHRNSQKQACPQGHPYDEKNTRTTKSGDRKCRTCERDRNRRVRESNPEYVRRAAAKYRAAHPELHRQRAKQWAKQNPDKANAISRLKKQRRRATGVITRQEWEALLEAHGGMCLACGSSDDLTLDHVVPVSVGGMNVIENAQPLCRSCNCSKGTKVIDYRPVAA